MMMKYYLIACVLYLSSSCSTLHLISSIADSQVSYLKSANNKSVATFNEINLSLKEVASEIESGITVLDKTFFGNDTIFVLSAFDFETGAIIGQIWSGNNFYSFEIIEGEENSLIKVNVSEGVLMFFKECNYIIEECKTMKVIDRELNPGEIEGGMYFLLSKVINSRKLKIETIAFEQW